LNQADDLTTLLKTAFNEGHIDQLREKWVGGYEDVPTGKKHPKSMRAPLTKELCELLLFVIVKNSEPGQWLADAPPDSRGNSPDTTTSAPELILFFGGVFFQTVRRICDDGVDTVRLTVLHPFEAISLNKLIGGFAWLVDCLGLSDCWCETGNLMLFVAVTPEGCTQNRRSFGWMLPQDLLNISRQVTSQNQEWAGIYSTDFGEAPDHRFSGPSLTLLKTGNVPF